MDRNFYRFAAGVVILLGFLAWQSSQATFLFKHPKLHGARAVIDNHTGAAVVMREAIVVEPTAAAAPAKQPPAAQPKAAIAKTDFDFGVMDPLTDGQHDFVIHNDGQAPLKLTVGPTSCKCTLSGLARGELPPGESTTVTLQWNTGRNEHFAHSGTIYTNDPLRKSLELRVAGNVRVLFGIDEPEIALGTLDPDQPTVTERLIYSQYYTDIAIAKLEHALKGLTWELSPVDPATVPALSAKAVQRLRVTIPGGLPQGPFGDTLRLTVTARQDGREGDGTEEVQQLALPLSGQVPRRLAFYGPDVDSHGTIELGDVPAEHTARRVQIVARLRDRDQDLPGAKIETFPEFLQARLEPVASKRGFYHLTVELPEGVPAGQYHNDRTGRIRIDTGHPRIGVVELKVTFAVIPRSSL